MSVVAEMLDIEKLVGILFTVLFGALGYLSANFWFQPILRYRDIKNQVASDLVFYANALERTTLQGKIRDDTLEREEANRRRAAELAAVYPALPYWYKWFLRSYMENPVAASAELLGLSNASNKHEALECVQNIKKLLKLSLQRP